MRRTVHHQREAPGAQAHRWRVPVEREEVSPTCEPCQAHELCESCIMIRALATRPPTRTRRGREAWGARDSWPRTEWGRREGGPRGPVEAGRNEAAGRHLCMRLWGPGPIVFRPPVLETCLIGPSTPDGGQAWAWELMRVFARSHSRFPPGADQVQLWIGVRVLGAFAPVV